MPNLMHVVPRNRIHEKLNIAQGNDMVFLPKACNEFLKGSIKVQ